MEFVYIENSRNISEKELIDDLQKVAEKIGSDYVSRSVYEKNGKYSATPYIKKYGSWLSACDKAGLRTKLKTEDLVRISDKKLLADINKIASQLNKKSITTTEYKKYGIYKVQTILTRFGTWEQALILSGLESTGYRIISDEDLFSEIERLWMIKGRQPTTADIRKGDSKYSLNTYVRRFGGWTKTLKAFIDYVSNDESYVVGIEKKSTSIIEKHDEVKMFPAKTRHKTPRDINLKLRFKVLQRDNFKCCACGASPAKNPNVTLHVDHIIPWSKGGETEIDNLQTLCSTCNLGKSDML